MLSSFKRYYQICIVHNDMLDHILFLDIHNLPILYVKKHLVDINSYRLHFTQKRISRPRSGTE